MDESPENTSALLIDVENVLRSKNPSLAKAIPSFVINYLKRIIHQDDINSLISDNADLRDAEFIAAVLKTMKISYKVYGRENIPVEGRYFFVSNHPLGGLDGLVFMDELSKHFNSIKFPVNDLLMNIKNFSGIFLPVNKHGGQVKDAVRLLEETYASDSQILYFPAGLCSRKKHGAIKDLVWHKSFVSKAIQHKRDIVPAYFQEGIPIFFITSRTSGPFWESGQTLKCCSFPMRCSVRREKIFHLFSERLSPGKPLTIQNHPPNGLNG